MRAVVYGSRVEGHGKVCLRLARLLGFECVGWLDDRRQDVGTEIDGMPLLGGRDILSSLDRLGVTAVVLGFGHGRSRRTVMEAVRDAGLSLPPLVHPDAGADPSATVAGGAVVLRRAILGDDVRVGEAALVNVGAVVTHDVEIGTGASVGPGAVLAGRSRVGRDAELGAGAILLPDAVVGDGAVVGAGAVVTGAVDPGTTVVGVPARPLPSKDG